MRSLLDAIASPMPPGTLDVIQADPLEAQLLGPCQVDRDGLLFVSAEITDWRPIARRRVQLVIDLEGELDGGVPTIPDHLIYAYFPFVDRGLPDPVKLHALAAMAAQLIRIGQAVLIHCQMGLNRSPLVAGVTLTHLGMSGAEALIQLRACRAGALYNQTFADYLASLPARSADDFA